LLQAAAVLVEDQELLPVEPEVVLQAQQVLVLMVQEAVAQHLQVAALAELPGQEHLLEAQRELQVQAVWVVTGKLLPVAAVAADTMAAAAAETTVAAQVPMAAAVAAADQVLSLPVADVQPDLIMVPEILQYLIL
jgi:hypothetical protein